MSNFNTKTVAHFRKFVPCCEGRVLLYLVIGWFSSGAAQAFNPWTDEDCRKTSAMFSAIQYQMSDESGMYGYGRKIQDIESRMKGDIVFGEKPETPNAEDLREADKILTFLTEKQQYLESNYHSKCEPVYSSSAKKYGYRPPLESITQAKELVEKWVSSASIEATRQTRMDANLPVFNQEEKDKYSSLFEGLGSALLALRIQEHQFYTISEAANYSNPDAGWDKNLFRVESNTERSRMDYLAAFHKLASNEQSYKKYRGSCEMKRFDFYCDIYSTASNAYIEWINKILETDYENIVDVPSPQAALEIRKRLVSDATRTLEKELEKETQHNYMVGVKERELVMDLAKASGLDSMFDRFITMQEFVNLLTARVVQNNDVNKAVVIHSTDKTYRVTQVERKKKGLIMLTLEPVSPNTTLQLVIIIRDDNIAVFEGDYVGQIGDVFRYREVFSVKTSQGSTRQRVYFDLMK